LNRTELYRQCVACKCELMSLMLALIPSCDINTQGIAA
jgi:hypothetical protein